VDFSSLFSQQFCSSTSTILGEQTMFWTLRFYAQVLIFLKKMLMLITFHNILKIFWNATAIKNMRTTLLLYYTCSALPRP
jgi:hypothetical protein